MEARNADLNCEVRWSVNGLRARSYFSLDRILAFTRGGRNEMASRVKLNGVKRSVRTSVNAVNGVKGVNALRMTPADRTTA